MKEKKHLTQKGFDSTISLAEKMNRQKSRL